MTGLLHLLHRAGQVADESFYEVFGEDITPRQWQVLMAVQASSVCSQTDIVNATSIDRSTLADIVRRLCSKGYLQRTRNKHDCRAYDVRLTAEGTAFVKKHRRTVDSIDRKIVGMLSAEAREQLGNLLMTLVSSAQKSKSVR